MRLKGKTAFITGAASGIGKASALLFAREGADVVLVDVNQERLEQTCNELSALPGAGRCLAVEASISSEEQLEHAYRRADEAFGRLDIVFANAGVNGTLAPLESMKAEEWSRTIETNLTGTFLTIKHAIPRLKQAGGGSILVTSSINGNRVFTSFGMSAYSTSKAGQVALVKMAALELAQFGIRVNAICPGAIDTSIDESTDLKKEVEEIAIPVEFPAGAQPLAGKSGSAEQAAKLALFLASDDSDHVTGTEIYLDGAESLLRG
ncbi:SDR family oxidoreductase [Paenibacillus albicereus]|uniref:SDR family oxidoreductase n=1 Tax=Paenibacillus albicereus TaxID=2726185 RepID=A0A6H2GV09_9BACL|nr:SDR family NAD(P)-dependent oxidoreductase [Paenibacillus albicereus]QJC51189.1 SDR family oxidoreductase [Paenibacillus albicereus]